MVDLTLYLITFNCGRAIIEPDVFGRHIFDAWTGTNSAPDVLVLNLQEVAPIGLAFLGHNWVKPYFDAFRNAVRVGEKSLVGSEEDVYVNVLSRNSGLTAIMVFVKEDRADLVSSINVAEVGVGFSEMANKGAIGARIGWQHRDTNSRLYTTFVSAHLAPFEAEVQRRDQDYNDIVRGLIFTKEDAREGYRNRAKDEDAPLLSDDLDQSDDPEHAKTIYANDSYAFFCGDLNYRTALTIPGRDDSKLFPQPCTDHTDPKHYSHLLEKDQLSQQLHTGKTLYGFSEAPIDFAPTYKYKENAEAPVLFDRDLSEWRWARHRWPSWCDRILFSSVDVKVSKYVSLPIFRTSDHRPVALSATIPFEPIDAQRFAQYNPNSIDKHYLSRRVAARRKEIVVGLLAYLGLTWEGNSVIIGLVLMGFGITYMFRAITV